MNPRRGADCVFRNGGQEMFLARWAGFASVLLLRGLPVRVAALVVDEALTFLDRSRCYG